MQGCGGECGNGAVMGVAWHWWRGVVLMLTAADLGILHHGLKILIILIFITAIICAFNKFSVTLQL